MYEDAGKRAEELAFMEHFADFAQRHRSALKEIYRRTGLDYLLIDGAETRAGKLLIQRCKGCGTLRHPPGPVCPSCHSFEWDTVEASGRGTVYSFVVMHYPEVAPFDHPNPIALIELEEGTRLISQLVGVKPGEVRIGEAVQVEFNSFNDGELVLPQFRPVAATQGTTS
jgi:uncharacterized OB-fold protein